MVPNMARISTVKLSCIYKNAPNNRLHVSKMYPLQERMCFFFWLVEGVLKVVEFHE